MLDDVCRPTIPVVQSKPAPQNSAVQDAPMLTESASHRDICAVSPDLFERFKTPSHTLSHRRFAKERNNMGCAEPWRAIGAHDGSGQGGGRGGGRLGGKTK